MTPSEVQRRYEGMGWYVSARIYDAHTGEELGISVRTDVHWNIYGRNHERTLPFSTRTEAMMSSGSPILFKGGTFRASKWEDVGQHTADR